MPITSAMTNTSGNPNHATTINMNAHSAMRNITTTHMKCTIPREYATAADTVDNVMIKAAT